MKPFVCLWAVLLVGLAGCTTTPPASLDVTVSGARFVMSEFDCGQEPLPPNPKTITPRKGGSAAVRDRAALRSWGKGCQNKLNAVGQKAIDAGQVLDANGNPVQ